MSFLGSLFPGDKELGKKDDDHRPGNNVSLLPGSWTARRQVSGVRRRRVIYAVLGIIAIFLFIKNIPSDLGSNRLKGDSRVVRHAGSLAAPTQQDVPSGKPPRPSESSEEDEHYFKGPVKFYKLAATLYAVAPLAGHYGHNKNILFAASSLKSASEIMPLACEMASLERNDVHFAFMGREDLEIHEIREINGINEDECNVHWHDGRPDFSRWSSDFRMEVSVTAGIGHIHKFVTPQAIIIDNSQREDSFFVNSIKSKATELATSLIELPNSAVESMRWISRLDSGSLAAWQTTYVDLLIRAPPKSSGSLLRLLKSIEAADYFGYRRPHITVELPADIDAPTFRYLENLVWPPLDWSGSSHTSQITLRHRLPKRSFTEEEASSYLVESFYPARPLDSHVLIISPQVELSPLYYHYLIYNLLQLRYSRSSDIDYLMGISLELPAKHLDGSTPLDTPNSKTKPKDPVPFLWEAPNCNAALYFGERWMEFHSFLSNRMSTMRTTTPKLKKQITKDYPAWMEYLLELMRARGYVMFYPHYESTVSNAFATVHSELNQPPEEYANKASKKTYDESPPAIEPQDELGADSASHAKTKPHPPETPLLESSLLSLIPSFEDSPLLSSLPHMSYDGTVVSSQSRPTLAENYARTFRHKIGGCALENGKVIKTPALVERSADDLFCNLNEPPEVLLGQMNIDPVSTASQATSNTDSDVYDEDVIPADSTAQIQDEFSAHLQRQSGETKKKSSDGTPAVSGGNSNSVPFQWDPKVEEDKLDIIPTKEMEDAKSEFEKHLARQGDSTVDKAAGGNLKPPTSNSDGLDVKAAPDSEKQTAQNQITKQKMPAGDGGTQGTDAGTSPGSGGVEQRKPGW